MSATYFFLTIQNSHLVAMYIKLCDQIRNGVCESNCEEHPRTDQRR